MFGNGKNDLGGSTASGVISLTAHEKSRTQTAIRVVEAYWHGLVENGKVPLRSAVDPRGMESALENAFLLERIAPGMAKIRVAGGHLSDMMGMQVTGMPLSTLIAAEDRDRFAEAIKSMFAEPAIIRLTLASQEGFGRPAISAQMVVMPLRSDFGEVTRALGAFVSEGRIGRAPRRFTITSVDVERIDTATAPDAAPLRREAVTPTPAPTLRGDRMPTPRPAVVSDAPASVATHVPGDARPVARGHLTLVVCND
ncbi:PAS domain-containing protein [Citreimonas salinaria]|uniref:PAS domain-containing protein n=1 Tax=Citreimonas salinaria TaxID=321339 RepID=A0A1H3IGM7_9RHOB|nr:PAS domain-containing protein [Citreimonas salinaria]SDY26535.1 PAS domain-containing protein [Citreimonas salinaria]